MLPKFIEDCNRLQPVGEADSCTHSCTQHVSLNNAYIELSANDSEETMAT